MNPLIQKFILLCLLSSFWQGFSGVLFNLYNKELADIFSKIVYLPIIFLSSAYLDFSMELFNVHHPKIVKASYYSSILFLILLPSNLLISGAKLDYFGYYTSAGPLLFLYIIQSTFSIGFVFYTYYKYIKNRSNKLPNAAHHLFVLGTVSLSFVCLDFLVNYGFSFYPFGFLFLTIFIVLSLYSIYLRIADDLRAHQKNLLILEKNKTFSNIAKQVSHDIRSPLTALNMMLGSIGQVPEQQRIIMRSAIIRLNDIANDLLAKGKKVHQENTSSNHSLSDPLSKKNKDQKIKISSQLISPLVDSIVSEKRIEYREKQNIEIIADIDQAYGLFAHINSSELKRVISNLLNNSIESMTNNNGRIVVGIRGYRHFVCIIIQDNGKGIPHHIINKLGEMGLSYGKEGSQSGFGMGIFHAKKTVERFGGRFDIASREGSGTTISMNFPKTQTPPWFVDKLVLKKNQKIISLDDDLSIHGVWKGRFESSQLSEKGIEHLTFTSGAEFKNWFYRNSGDISERLYLVDYELLNQNQTGLKIIEDLGIGSQSILVSSRYEENQIRQKCDEVGAKLIPKSMACLVPIEIENPNEKYRYEQAPLY